MADMDKLMEFLQKEVPSNAGDLNNSLNNALEIIERTRAAVIGSVPKLYQNGRHDEVNNFTDADRQLMHLENYLKDFIRDIPNIQKEQAEPNNIKIKSTDIRQKFDYEICKVDDTKPYSLDADFSKKRPVAFTFEGKRYDVQSWKRFIVMVCELLNDKNSELFQSFPEDDSMQGRKRKYFIRQSSPYHKKVARTGVWVLTNNDGSANCRIVIKMFEKYDIPITSMEIFIQSDYSLRDDENDDIDIDENVKKKLYIDKQETESDSKIGKYAKDYFTTYFSNPNKQYDLKNFTNKYWCNDNLGICYPLLKEVDLAIPISQQKGYNNNYARYWTKPILKLNGKYYIICSQWFESFRPKLDKWISEQNPQNSNLKMEVYVLPKLKTKTCPKCGTKTEREILYVTYHTALTDIKNQLFTRRCNSCKMTYMADTIFKSYTRSKNIEDINLNFIQQDI